MTKEQPYLDHLNSSTDLITTYEATRAGFVSAALEKNKLAEPFINKARTLKIKASRAKEAKDLKNYSDIKAGLLTASGISDKALTHIRETDHDLIIDEFIKNFLEPAGDLFVEELVFRFLLIRGDTLGGKMRNLAGLWAQYKFSKFLVSDMSISGRDFLYLKNSNKRWVKGNEGMEIEDVKGFYWKSNNMNRTLIFNLKVPLIKNLEEEGKSKKGKGVDICLFNCPHTDLVSRTQKANIINNPEKYIALGEIKGGIDPAGADEHWKTANTALSRIRDSFKKLNNDPNLLFIGSAIATSMADEIWSLLTTMELSNAANLNCDDQMVSLTSWILSL